MAVVAAESGPRSQPVPNIGCVYSTCGITATQTQDGTTYAFGGSPGGSAEVDQEANRYKHWMCILRLQQLCGPITDC